MPSWRQQFSTGYIDPRTLLPSVSPAQSSAVVSTLSAGNFFGALAAAPLGDQLGRKPSLMIGTLVFSLGVVLQLIAAKVPLFIAGRY